MAWLLPVGLGIILPITALLDAVLIPSAKYTRAGRSKTNVVVGLILIPAIAAAYWWISARWIVTGDGADRSAGSTRLSRQRFGPMLARSILASVVVALLWSAQDGMSPSAVLVLTAVMVIPVFVSVLIIDVGGVLLADERARNARAGERRDLWA
jgi:hypothetical protein